MVYIMLIIRTNHVRVQSWASLHRWNHLGEITARVRKPLKPVGLTGLILAIAVCACSGRERKTISAEDTAAAFGSAPTTDTARSTRPIRPGIVDLSSDSVRIALERNRNPLRKPKPIVRTPR